MTMDAGAIARASAERLWAEDAASNALGMQLISIEPGRAVVWSHPAFANRCVYARNDKEIACVSLAASRNCPP